MDDHQNEPPKAGGELVRQPHGGALRPFTKGDPVAAAGREKAVATLREQRALKTARVADVRRLLTDLVDALPRDQLGPAAAAVAQDVIARVASGDIKVRHAGDAAELLRVLVDVARLEDGQATSHMLRATVDRSEAIAHVRELQAKARAAIEGSSDAGEADGS